MTFRRPLAWLALLLAASSTPAQEVAWRKDYATALKEAKEKGKPLFLTFTMIGCRWCHTLDLSTYRDPAVARALEERFVPLRVQAEDYPDLVKWLGIQSYPTIVVASPAGRILEIHKGYLEAAPLGELLSKAIAKLPAESPAAAVAVAPAAQPEEKTPAVKTAVTREPVPAKTAAIVKEVATPEPPVAKADPVPTPPGPPSPDAPGEAAVEPAWVAEDFQKAKEAVARSEFNKALPLLRRIIMDPSHWPTQVQAAAVFRDIERKATEQLTKVKESELRNRIPEAIELARELVAQFDGTETASESLSLLASLNARLEDKDRERMKSARLMLVMAREDFRADQFLPCLLRCEEVVARYSDLPQALEAGELAKQIKDNPERLQRICDNLPEVLGQVYLMTAEVKLKQGEPQQAVFFLERVMQAFPHSKHAEIAQVRLSQLQGPPATGAGADKSP